MDQSKLEISDEGFKLLQCFCMDQWIDVGANSHYSYKHEKFKKVMCMNNVGDNYLFLIGMFDIHNQRALFEKMKQHNHGGRELREKLLEDMAEMEYNVGHLLL